MMNIVNTEILLSKDVQKDLILFKTFASACRLRKGPYLWQLGLISVSEPVPVTRTICMSVTVTLFVGPWAQVCAGLCSGGSKGPKLTRTLITGPWAQVSVAGKAKLNLEKFKSSQALHLRILTVQTTNGRYVPRFTEIYRDSLGCVPRFAVISHH